MVARRGTDSDNTGTANGTTVTMSLTTAGAQVGDWAVAWASRNGNVTFTIDRTGWDETESDVSSVCNNAYYIKQLVAQDITDDTITITASASGRVAGGLVVIQDTSGLDSVTVNPVETIDAGAAATLAFDGIDPVDSSYLVACSAYNVTVGTAPVFGSATDSTFYNKIIEDVTTNTTGARIGIALFEPPTNPTSTNPGSDTATFLSSETGLGITRIYAFAPAAAGEEDSVNATDDTTITDITPITQAKGLADTLNLTDAKAFTLSKVYSDVLDVTDTITVSKVRLSSHEDSIALADEISKIYSKGFFDFLNTTDQIHIAQQKATVDNLGVTDEIVVTKSKFKLLEFVVGITDSIGIILKKAFTSIVGLRDETSLPGVTEIPMSLVDEKRVVIGAALGIVEPDLSALSINDLLHRYWSMDFPALHVYDGSESGLTPKEAFSIMDHFTTVERNEATDLDWIRGVVA